MFTLGMTKAQYDQSALLLLRGSQYMQYLNLGQQGPKEQDPRGRLAGLRDRFRGVETTAAVYADCVNACIRVGRFAQPLFRQDSEGVETQLLLKAVEEGNADNREALKAYVNRLKAYGALPAHDSHLNGYYDFVNGALVENTVYHLERARYVGAVYFLMAATRFTGIENKKEILAGTKISLDTILLLGAENMDDSVWNQSVDLYLTNEQFIRDSLAGSVFVEDEITASVSYSKDKQSEGLVSTSHSFLEVGLMSLYLNKVLPPRGSTLDAIQRYFDSLGKVRKRDFSHVSIEKRAGAIWQPMPLTSNQKKLGELLKALTALQQEIPTNTQDYYKQFIRNALWYIMGLKEVLGDAGLSLHETRENYLRELVEGAKIAYQRLSTSAIPLPPEKFQGMGQNFLADLLNVDPFYLDITHDESWEGFLHRMSSAPIKKKPGHLAHSSSASDSANNRLDEEAIIIDPDELRGDDPFVYPNGAPRPILPLKPHR